MYCRYCGTELDDNDKFCRNCGQRTSDAAETYDVVPVETEQYGILYIKRKKNSWKETIPVDIYIDGIAEDSIENGETVEFELEVGIHEILLMQQGRQVGIYETTIFTDYPDEISFEISPPDRSSNANIPAKKNSSSLKSKNHHSGSGKICPKCGGNMSF